MIDGPSSNPEVGREHYPTLAEVLSVIREEAGEKTQTERRRCEDANGLYLLEVVVAGEDGASTEYIYTRAGQHREAQSETTVIQALFFDKDGMPFSGHNVADLVNGEWKKTS